MTRCGILGAGQLALYLKESCRDLDVEPWCLAGSRIEPAAIDEPNVVIGVDHDSGDLKKIFSKVDIVTFENEFVDLKALKEASDAYPGVVIYPSMDAIALCQNKLKQKRLLNRLKIPTSKYLEFNSIEGFSEKTLKNFLKQAASQFPGGFVLKWAQGGYDGKGNFSVDQSALGSSLDSGFFKSLFDFSKKALESGSELYAEEKIYYETELALVSAFSKSKAYYFYPLVMTLQEQGVCRQVLGPFQVLADNDFFKWVRGKKAVEIEKEAQRISRMIASALDYEGVLALEFFLQQDGSLLVNELAPRVHNSGHHTLDSHESSQFDLHIQSGLGRSFPKEGAFSENFTYGMLNIIGDCASPRQLAPNIDHSLRSKIQSEEITLYWYNKSKLKKGRKMGHLNFVAPDFASLKGALARAQNVERAIQGELLK